MPTLLLNFANNEQNHLASLRNEDDAIYAHLIERIKTKAFILVKDQYATTTKIISNINSYRDDLVLFWFSGHAGRDKLVFEDEEARSEGIAQILGQCRDLILVGLNGCSTKNQVQALLEKGIAIVIATSAPVNDDKAAKFGDYFFKELSQHRSIREAFNTAIANVNIHQAVEGEIIHFRDTLEINEPEKSQWILYHNEKGKNLLDSWRLPSTVQTNHSDANKLILRALEIIGKNANIALTDNVEQRNLALTKLPFMVSEPIRRLLAPNDNNGSEQQFYDLPSPQRYDMLLFAYQSILSFLCYVLMGQLWKNKDKLTKNETLSFEVDFLDWLSGDYQRNKQQLLLNIFERLANLSIATDVPFFIPELEKSVERLKDPKVKVHFLFFNDQFINGSTLSPETKTFCCHELELRFASILILFRNLIGYSLVSIKEIGVLNYMHDVQPIYDHKIVRVQISNTGIDDVNQKIPNFLKTAAVLLTDENDKNFERCLFLSPFLIDKNAYIISPKANLMAFDHYDRQTKAFYYRDAGKKNDEFLCLEVPVNMTSAEDYFDPFEDDEKDIASNHRSSSDYYSLIFEQFSAFSKDMFGKKLDEL
ncbi:CHAT domain-containing protein [Haliscomenobacter hydrossis]|uniref:Uncharacterized protein n=1 Tax=Haliscomenobacter hydrossis (strain ATCC 27775 / DSM 1100 / LMG 10767 / O) TaxID=760192 RepID=F4L1S6_HALH1|nr:CHAT domain-containing protein [Haliscomenobacter hydrossis]AEE49585.1 hypothetical protein Halhy_1696 [Haliscomenobacter hydrossis DSM 1100]